MTSLPDGTVTLLFTDVEGSTRHVLRLGDAYSNVLTRLRDIVLQRVTAHRGSLVDTQGDTVFSVFGAAHEAVVAAVELQQALNAESWPGGEPIYVRVGIHTGEPTLGADGYTGLDVHRAARICSAAHGGQIIVSQTTRSLALHGLPPELTLIDLGYHRLKDIPQPEHLIQVVSGNLPREFPPPRTLGAPAGLPPHRLPLIGRDDQLEACRRLLVNEGVRLLSLTGPGGTGKTALAIHLAASLTPHFQDGVYYVALAALSEPSLVPRALARALGVQEVAPRPLLGALKDALSSRHCLLVLDNFEHLLAAGDLVADLLLTCPYLNVVVTSRELLRLTHEYELPVPPLPLPSLGEASTAALAENHAVRLFVTRAMAVRPSFSLTEDVAPVVAEICRRLDGLPLALELAAARIRLLPPKALLARLDRRLPMLTDGPRDLPARQRTLRDTIGWSYGLLSAEEARIFRVIGSFVGGCSLGALERVANYSGRQSDPTAGRELGGSPIEILDLVASLVDKSLVRQTMIGDEPRFSMLETIREFAVEQLDSAGELVGVRERHASYFLALVEEADPHLISADQVRWLDQLELEQGNLAAALAVAWRSHAHQPAGVSANQPSCDPIGLRLAGGLHWFWWLGGHVGEGRRWLRDFLTCQVGPMYKTHRARALYAAGTLAMIQGDYDEALELLKAGEAIGEGLGNNETHGLCLTYRGILEAYAHESGRMDRQTPIRTAERAYRLLERTGNLWGQALALSQLGAHARRAGEHEESERLLRRAVTIARTVGERYLIGSCLPKLGNLYMDVRDYEAAEPLYREALAAFRELREAWWTGRCLHYLALASGGRGDNLRAALLIGSSDEQLDQSGAQRNPAERRKYEELMDQLRERLGDSTFDDVYSRGRQTALNAIMSHALEEVRPVSPR